MTIEDLQNLPHKAGVNASDWLHVDKDLVLLAYFYVGYARALGLPILFTSIIRAMIAGVSKTDIHADGRAFDFSVVGWTRKHIDDFVLQINSQFTVGAISKKDGVEREAVYEDGITQGRGAHVHCQVRKKAAKNA